MHGIRRMKLNYVAVGLGGVIGALLRYAVSVTFSQMTAPFPLGTIVVNLVGSFLLAFLTTKWFVHQGKTSPLMLGVGTGMIGSFTTFSTFSVELVELVEQNMLGLAFLYCVISLFGGAFLTYVGYKVGRRKLI